MGGGAGRRDADTSASTTADTRTESGPVATVVPGEEEEEVDGGPSMRRRGGGGGRRSQ